MRRIVKDGMEYSDDRVYENGKAPAQNAGCNRLHCTLVECESKPRPFGPEARGERGRLQGDRSAGCGYWGVYWG